MDTSTLQLMQDRVRTIYRALTGNDLTETRGAPSQEDGPPPDQVMRQFAELEAVVRSVPSLAERLPPFSFVPALDAAETERELLVEIGVPGVEREDVNVEVHDDLLVVSGTRRGDGAEPRTYYHAEIPRGPFHRVWHLPYAVGGEPRVRVENGLISIRLARPVKAAPAKA
jgi:HSP20 family molecular chaperone IbpA